MVPAELYRRIRRRLDMENSVFDVDEEIGLLCEESYLDLWDFLVGLLGEEAPWERVSVVTTSNEYVDLPDALSIYRVLRIEFKGTGDYWEPLQRGNLTSDPIQDTREQWVSASSVRYFLRRAPRSTYTDRVGTGIFADWRLYFTPPPVASPSQTLRVYYIPPPQIAFTYAGNIVTFTAFPDDFPEYVVSDVCAKLKHKEEADATPFEAERERIKERIERYCKPHQMGQPMMVADMRRHQNEGEEFVNPFMRRRS